MKYSGIRHFNLRSYENLKREFLYFDTIYFDGYSFEKLIRNYRDLNNLMNIDLTDLNNIEAEVDYLINRKILSEISFTDISSELMLHLENSKKGQAFDILSEHEKISILNGKGYLDIILEKANINFNKRKSSNLDIREAIILQKEFLAIHELESEFWVRMNCTLLPTIRSDDEVFTPIVNILTPYEEHSIGRKSEVIELIINQFPIPDNTVSWEQLIDFRLDSEANQKLLALKNWITKIGHSNLNKNEILQEFTYLKNEYENRMRLQKIKFNVSNFEVLITTGLEVLGNTVSFQWGKAAKALFDVNKRNVDLLIGESKAPGRELAYISKLNEKFNTKH